MWNTIHSFRLRSYYLRKRMFCLSTGLWALGTPKSEYSWGTVSTLEWDVNVSWPLLGRGHPRGKGRHHPGTPGAELELHSSESPQGQQCLFPCKLRYFYSSASFLSPQLCCPWNTQAARNAAAPVPCHTKRSGWQWLWGSSWYQDNPSHHLLHLPWWPLMRTSLITSEQK